MGIRDDDGVWSVRLERTPSARIASGQARGAASLAALLAGAGVALSPPAPTLASPPPVRHPLFVWLVAKERLRAETA